MIAGAMSLSELYSPSSVSSCTSMYCCFHGDLGTSSPSREDPEGSANEDAEGPEDEVPEDPEEDEASDPDDDPEEDPDDDHGVDPPVRGVGQKYPALSVQ